ncbi:hypothetical protein ABEV74_04650 [Paenibacillus cisolokensis]|uniref:hypothetical protein n=1 Tax=Paenibacillus cisolokensis TaxID=1658519 RepID=UPI003D2DF29A
MDRKTLEYLEERAKKARAIVNRIEHLTIEIERVKRTYGIEFCALRVPNVRVGTWDDEKIKNQFTAELVANLVKVFIDLALKEIRRLEAELAEL